MLKRLCLALAGLFAFVSLAQGAGTVPGFSLTPQFDLTGHVAPGCKLYVYQAGTVATPQNPYQDSGLSILQTNPILCDAAGRLPQWFAADGTIKLRLTTSNGNQIFVGDNLLVVGPSSGGGGGGGTVDPTTILATGDIKIAYNTGIYTGFVRANGRTIGSSTSGATERANSDCQSLFSFLWGNDANLAVSGGRGASASADWAANKTIALPDYRGRALAGLDDMGNTAAGRLTSTYFGTGATTLGSAGSSSESTTLTLAQLPTGITSIGNISVNVPSAQNVAVANAVADGSYGAATAGGTHLPIASGSSWSGIGTLGPTSNTMTSNNTSGSAHRTVPPTMLATIYIKL